MNEKKHKSLLRILIKNSFLIGAYFVLFLLIISFLSPYISPKKFFIPAFIGLAFPYIFAVIFILFIFILFRKYKKHIFIFLPFVIYGFYISCNYYRFNFFNSQPINNKAIKVMSYNVRLFDLYNWKNNLHGKNKIFKLLENENPAILCLQEYYYQNDGEFPTTDTLIKFLSANNIHAYFPVVNKNKYFFGIATLTKFPIINKGRITFEGTSNMSIFTDILLWDDTVRIYNNHLESVRFGKEDYNFINKLDFDINNKEVKDSKNILRRLKNAFIKRAKQADIISAHIAHCHYPVIVCGDFNDTPDSYAYKTISKGLKDAYCESGKGIGSTYNGKIPFLRIDFILHSPKFNAYNFKVNKDDLSDHFPVTCLLELK